MLKKTVNEMKESHSTLTSKYNDLIKTNQLLEKQVSQSKELISLYEMELNSQN